MEASTLRASAGAGFIAGPRLLRLRSDDQLVALFRAGNEEAFAVLHDRYRQRLFAYVRQMLGAASRGDAEDVLQDVFVRAYFSLRADDRPMAARAWLYRVAHNRCIDAMRRPAPIPAEQQDTPAGDLHDPLSELTRRDDLRRLVTDLGRLPEQQRSALLMRELEGLSYAELAAALGCTLPAVKSLLVRARIGLAESHASRDAACSEIRSDLAATHDRRVRASAHARRHMRDCADCRSFRAAMQGSSREMDALTPSSGPLVWLTKLLGLGGSGAAGSGLAGGTAGGGAAGLAGGGGAAGLGGGIAGGTGVAVGGGAVAATATKVAVVVCCVAGVAGGAKKIEHRATQAAKPAASAAALVPVLPAAGAARDEPRLMEPAVAEKPAPMPHPAEPVIVPAAEEPAEQEVTGEASALSANGGVEAPDEPAEVTATSAEPAKDAPLEPASTTTTTPDSQKSTAPSSTTASQPTATDATVTSSPGATAAPAAAASAPPAG